MELAQAFVRLRVDSTQVRKDTETGLRSAGKGGEAKKAGAEAGGLFSGGFREKSTEGFKTAMDAIGIGVAVGAGAVIVKAAEMTFAFQEGLTTLVTGAGESEDKLKEVGRGLLGISVATGTQTGALIKGLYLIESAGYHGAKGLDVLRAAAEGAKVGNADLATVANAATTVMTDYARSHINATSAVNGLVTIVSRGKVHLEDLAGSMARVLPTASALNVSFAGVGGAMATMTGEGTSAKLAAQGLNATLLSLAVPGHQASKAMAALGLSSKTVADTLTHKGLVAALNLVQEAALRAGPVGSAPYVAAMKAMLGGSNQLRVGLQLTGSHMSTLVANTNAVSDAVKKSSGHVIGWALVQKDIAYKVDVLKAGLAAAAITIGTALIPVITVLLNGLITLGGYLKQLGDAALPVLKLAFTGLSIALHAVFGLVSGNKTVFLALGAAILSIVAAVKIAGIAQIVFTAILTGTTAAVNAVKFAMFALKYAFVTNPVGILVLALIALGVALYVAWTRSATFRKILEDAWRSIVSVALVAWAGLKRVFDSITAAFQFIITWVTGTFDKWWAQNGAQLEAVWRAAWTVIKAVFTVLWNAVVLALKADVAIIKALWTVFGAVLKSVWHVAWALIQADFKIAWAIIQTAFKVGMALLLFTARTTWAAIKTVLKIAWDIITGLFTIFLDIITGKWGKAWRDAQNLVHQIWNAIRDFFHAWWGALGTAFNSSLGAIKALLSNAWGTIRDTTKAIWGTIKHDVGAAVDAISSKISAVWGTISGNTKRLWNAIGGFMGSGMNAGKAGLAAAVNFATQNVLNPLIRGYNSVNNIWSGADVAQIPRIKLRAGGRIRTGTTDTADDVTIRVSKNETILSAAHSRILAPALSALGVPGYAAGGKVSGDAIAADAERYVGHRYIFGGPSRPNGGWDCSSFANYIYGHDFGLRIPGGSWSSTTGTGARHGPATGAWRGFWQNTGTNPKLARAGQMVLWPTHMGIARGANSMVSAYDTARGTINTSISGGGPGGEALLGIFNPSGVAAGGLGGHLSAAQVKQFAAYMALLNADIKQYSPGGAGPVRGFSLDPTKYLQWYWASGGNSAKKIKPAVQARYDQAVAAAGAGGGGGGGVPIPGGVSALQRYAASLFPRFAWAANELGSLIKLWNRESGWNPNAQNPTSTAYGIPQFLNTTWAGFGPKTSDPSLQILYGEEYIKGKYGDPNNAWAHELSAGWYSKGGKVRGYAVGGRIPEDVIGLGASGTRYQFERGENVQNQDQQAATIAELRAIRRLLDAAPGRTAGGVARAINGQRGLESQLAVRGAR